MAKYNFEGATPEKLARAMVLTKKKKDAPKKDKPKREAAPAALHKPAR